MVKVYCGYGQFRPKVVGVSDMEVTKHLCHRKTLLPNTDVNVHVTTQWYGKEIPADIFNKLRAFHGVYFNGFSTTVKCGSVVRFHAFIVVLLDDCEELRERVLEYRTEAKKMGLEPQHAEVNPHLTIHKFSSPGAAIQQFPCLAEEGVAGMTPDQEKELLGPLYGKELILENVEFVEAFKEV